MSVCQSIYLAYWILERRGFEHCSPFVRRRLRACNLTPMGKATNLFLAEKKMLNLEFNFPLRVNSNLDFYEGVLDVSLYIYAYCDMMKSPQIKLESEPLRSLHSRGSRTTHSRNLVKMGIHSFFYKNLVYKNIKASNSPKIKNTLKTYESSKS